MPGWIRETVAHKPPMNQLAELLDPEIGTVDHAQVAYVIIEPMQSEGGYKIPRQGFLEEIERLCKE